MAEIKMDLSEYEKMQENKRLLEDSLKNERTLREQIATLQKEKLEALESTKMKVVKVHKTIKEEALLKVRYSKHELAYILKSIQDLINNGSVHFDYGYERIIEVMAEKFFKKSIFFHEQEPVITTHGMEEIEEELRKQIIDSIDADIKRELESAKAFKLTEHELRQKYSKLESEISELKSTKNGLITLLEEKDVIIKSNEEIIASNVKFIDACTEAVKDHNMFNTFFILSRLKKALNL